jgi:hypothetical protein
MCPLSVSQLFNGDVFEFVTAQLSNILQFKHFEEDLQQLVSFAITGNALSALQFNIN